MNGTAARRSASVPPLEGAPPQELFADGVLPARPLPRGRNGGKSRVRGLSVQLAYAAIDATFVCLVGALMLWLRFGMAVPTATHRQLFNHLAEQAYIGFFLLYAALVVLGCANLDLYHTPRDRSVLDESMTVAKAVGLATTLLVLFIFISGYKDISRLVVVSAGALNVVTLSGWRYFKRQFVLRRTLEGIGVSRVLIVGAGRAGRALASWLGENRHLGYSVCGFLEMKPSADSQVLGTVGDLRSVALTHFVDELFVTLPAERELVKEMFLEAQRLRLNFHVVPDLYDGLGWQAQSHSIGGFSVLELHGKPIPALGFAVKRAIDILVASLGLILTASVVALAALWIRLDSPGPAFYSAPRVGWKGRRFRCHKLRTMMVEADAQKVELRKTNERDGPSFKMEKDPRITWCGTWLRKFSLDELPQLWNVLIGDMSLVGPRPHPIDDFERYDLEHFRRLDVKPGITGLWQVTARRDPSFETNIALDLEYIENWSLLLDLKILLRTAPAVLRGEGS